MIDKTVLMEYGMKDVVPYLKTYKEVSQGLPDPELLFGIELEIEGFRPQDNSNGFHFEADGSLRNNGQEAISQPIPARLYEDMLNRFFKQHKIEEANYSERCSTHLHMNVQDMSFNQVRVLCVLYQMFERLFFQWVGHDREENIFCVPWHQSGMSPNFVDRLEKGKDGVIRNWIKYSALNLLPMRTQGTVEFRHLHGTCNVPIIMKWLRLISRLAVYAKTTNYEKLTETILAMNTVSNYDMFMTDVFQTDVDCLMVGDYKAKLSVGVVDTKLMLMKTKTTDKYTVWDAPEGAELDAVVAQLGRAFERRPVAARQAAVDPDEAPVNPLAGAGDAQLAAAHARIRQWGERENRQREERERFNERINGFHADQAVVNGAQNVAVGWNAVDVGGDIVFGANAVRGAVAANPRRAR